MGSIPRIPHNPWIETPLIESAALSRIAGCRIFLKLDNHQPAHSFKSRGIGNYILQKCLSHPDPNLHFYSSSGGNAGLAAVTAGRALGHPVSVVVPTSTKEMMVKKIREAGAQDVVQVGATWAEADRYLREEILGAGKESNFETGIYVPPFDHPDIWAGAATIVEELERQLPDGRPPNAIICSVGGGGLFSGIQTGLEYAGWVHTTKVIAVEARGAESLSRSLQAGELVTLPGITSQATSLGATRVAAQAFELAQSPNMRSVVLGDKEAAAGVVKLAEEERIIVELACGVCVAVVCGGLLRELVEGFGEESRVVVEICGGANVNLEMVEEYRRMGLGMGKDAAAATA
ncbi:MAG: catabolic L-serine/threonine dehydratase [Cirrosporium novae-zelandiae]|nr:MAG: catabolic L-serine/threonine dehydratase [Cirrosporium novae-zelandiae]